MTEKMKRKRTAERKTAAAGRICRRAIWICLKAIQILFAVFTVSPLFFLVTGSIMGEAELSEYLSPVFTGQEGYACWRLLPLYPTLKNVVEVLFDSPEFFHMFWNTMKLTAGIILGQTFLAVPAAWGLARYSFFGKKAIYQMYLLLMMMPFQVMMLSEYLVLEGMGLNNTLWAVILPGVFSTFSVFLMYRFFSEVPEEILEAARVDGAGEMRMFLLVGLPLGRTGIASALLLQFLECFSMIEQPIAFLKDKTLYPLSLYLPEIAMGQTGFAFCASLIALLPPLFLFLAGSDNLARGIAAGAVKL